MNDILPVFLIDGYKADHRRQYPDGTTEVYSNLTPRKSRVANCESIVFFGLQYFLIEYLQRRWTEHFFARPRAEVVREYERVMSAYVGAENCRAMGVEHVAALHDVGYLPIEIKAVPEGSLVPMRVPVLTIRNTLPEFFWLTNHLETILSAEVWGPSTSATTAYLYRQTFDRYVHKTASDWQFTKWQGHDFSFRGMMGLEAAGLSGAGHLTSFTGTDTLPALLFMERYYGADLSKELVGGAVFATEHSVMCMGGESGELDTVRRLITEVYPSGIVSIVADSWDFWQFLSDYMEQLKPDILARDGKLVVRPDSGDPVKIICGDPEAPVGSPARVGAVEWLWEMFGGTLTDNGYKLLNPHVGVIYGDSITLDRQQAILMGLYHKGFSPNNVVLGIGSYCVQADTPILCSDLVWRRAGDLLPGQEILSFDENPDYGLGRKAARRYRLATIESNCPERKECSQVFTDIGDPIVASNDHPWLVWSKTRSLQSLYIGRSAESDESTNPHRGPGLCWKTTEQLQPGDRIAFLCKPWESETTHSAGWLAGMMDGEGCLSRSTRTDARIPAWKVCVSQNNGPVLERLRHEIKGRGFGVYQSERSCPQISLTGGWIDVLRFLGTIRPDRLMTKLPEMLSDMPALIRDRTYKMAVVSEVVAAGDQLVASIQTSNGTFITGGYLTHNTYQHVTRDTFGFAMKATYGRVNGEPRRIFKKPKTDDGTKASATGLLQVDHGHGGRLVLHQDCTPEAEAGGLLAPVFRDGKVLKFQTLSEIRQRLHGPHGV